MSDETEAGQHSRACGWRPHDHGTACHTNCPTCHGRPPSPVQPPSRGDAGRRDGRPYCASCGVVLVRPEEGCQSCGAIASGEWMTCSNGECLERVYVAGAICVRCEANAASVPSGDGEQRLAAADVQVAPPRDERVPVIWKGASSPVDLCSFECSAEYQAADRHARQMGGR